MRPNQQNKRSRSRGNNNRKNQNPLTRSYESNGPDVRIRGTAQHIADKYAQMARDANSSGDSVSAENYLQHAEHYARIILGAQAQQQQARAEQAERDNERDDRDRDDQNGDDGSEDDARQDEIAEAGAEKSTRARRKPEQTDDEDAPKQRRERRPRRRRVDEDNGDGGADASAQKQKSTDDAVDPASAPQPALNELPSFVTGGSDVKAAE